jgi:CBS domain-containing protein
LAKAVAHDKRHLHEIMTSKVITAKEDEAIDTVIRRMEKHNISGLPILDESNHIIGILTTDDISRKLVKGVTA